MGLFQKLGQDLKKVLADVESTPQGMQAVNDLNNSLVNAETHLTAVADLALAPAYRLIAAFTGINAQELGDQVTLTLMNLLGAKLKIPVVVTPVPPTPAPAEEHT